MHGQDADACHRMRGVTHSRACYRRRRSIYRPRTSQMMTTQVYASSMTVRPPRIVETHQSAASRSTLLVLSFYTHWERESGTAQAVASNYRGPTNFASPPRMFPSVSHHPLFLSARRLHSPPTTTSSPLRLPGAGWSRACTLRSEEKQLALGLVRIRRGNACGVAVEESLPRITEGVSDGRVAWGAVLQDLPPPGSPVPRRCSPSLHQVEHVDLRRRAVAQAVRGQMGSGCCGLLRAGATGFQAMEGRLRRAGPMRPIRTGRQDNQRRKRLLPHLPR